MKALIVGGGIGGLTTALMLHARGLDCEIFEQSETIRELGVGINTLPHAIKELAQLGLLDRLDQVAIRTHELFYLSRTGQEIWREPRGTDAGFEYPQFSIHRGRLQQVIYQAVRARIGESRINTGHRLGSFTQDEGGVTAYFFGPDGSHRHTARGDILIGADGIHSHIRQTLFPNEGQARWNGAMLYRGATDWPKFLTGRSMVIAGGMKAKVVVYPIAEGARPDYALTNWAVQLKISEGGLLPRDKQSWSQPGRFEDVMPHVQRFTFPFVDARALIEATPEFWEYPMCDRDPLPRWSHGRVTLLGDAAHPMYPIGSNGASQAILDGEAITQELLAASDPEVALRRYEERRLPPTARIVDSNRRKGIDIMLDIVEQRAPRGFSDLESVLPAEELEKIVGDYKRLVAQDRKTLLKLANAK